MASHDKGSVLIKLGYDSSAAPAEAIGRLRELRGKAGVSDAAVASALGRIASAEAVAMLTEMEAGASGADRREIRRALFRLRQRGFQPAVAEALPERAPSTAQETGLSALLSPIDGEGVRIVWILKSRPQGGGITRLFGLTSESDGLLGATITSLSRKELRGERAEVERRGEVRLVEADWRVADFIVCEAWRETAGSRRGGVGDFLALRAEMTASRPPMTIDHPLYSALPANAADPPAELLEEPEFASWKMSAEQTRPFIDEINEIRQSVIVLNRVQQEERVNAVIARAIGELLRGEGGARVRRRFEDTGYYLMMTGRRERAEQAAIAAAAIRDGADLARSPFFQTFVRNQLGARLAEEQATREQEPRLVVTPAEAMRAHQARARRGR